jgi:hypothetical protein
MTLQTDLESAVARVTADSASLRAIVHGPASGEASLVGGVKTVARAIADAETLIASQIGDLAGAVASAEMAAGTATTMAERVEAAGAGHLAALAAAETSAAQVVTDAGASVSASFTTSAEACRLHAARFAQPIETLAMKALEARLQRLLDLQQLLTEFAGLIDATASASMMSALTGDTGAAPESLSDSFAGALETALSTYME